MVDNETILTAIVNLSTKMEVYHGDFREFRSGVKVQIDALNTAAKDAKKWENVKVFVVLPVVAGLHALANKLGARI